MLEVYLMKLLKSYLPWIVLCCGGILHFIKTDLNKSVRKQVQKFFLFLT